MKTSNHPQVPSKSKSVALSPTSPAQCSTRPPTPTLQLSRSHTIRNLNPATQVSLTILQGLDLLTSLFTSIYLLGIHTDYFQIADPTSQRQNHQRKIQVRNPMTPSASCLRNFPLSGSTFSAPMLTSLPKQTSEIEGSWAYLKKSSGYAVWLTNHFLRPAGTWWVATGKNNFAPLPGYTSSCDKSLSPVTCHLIQGLHLSSPPNQPNSLWNT